MSDSDKAIICRLTTFPHPDPAVNRIKCGKACGYNVIVGINDEDSLGILFTDDLRISVEFAEKNNLLRKKDPATGKEIGGYLADNRHVKAIKLRGVRSEALFLPLSSLSYVGYDLSNLKEGDQLNELSGHILCEKYVTRATMAQKQGKGRENRGQSIWFRKHVDTDQFLRAGHLIPVGAKLFFTEKVHGTSQRIAYCYDEPKYRWYHKILHKLGYPKVLDKKYEVGTRNVILDGIKEGFHSNELRERAALPFRDKLLLGETIYYEIFGYEKMDVPIMPPHSALTLKDKTIKYREKITYDYGLPNGEMGVTIYRISFTNELGQSIEYPFDYVKARSIELKISHVKELHPSIIYDGDLEKLTELVQKLGDNHENGFSHPNEGVVVRYEHGLNWGVMKYKSFLFRVLEGIIKENDDYSDPEEIS